MVSCFDTESVAVVKNLFSLLFPFCQSWVGLMLMHQPFYIGGIDDVERAKSSAFGAAGTFFFIFCLSSFYMIKQGRKLTDRSDRYVADVHETEYGEIPSFVDDLPGGYSDDLPTGYTDARPQQEEIPDFLDSGGLLS